MTTLDYIEQCRIRQWLWATFGPRLDWKGWPRS